MPTYGGNADTFFKDGRVITRATGNGLGFDPSYFLRLAAPRLRQREQQDRLRTQMMRQQLRGMEDEGEPLNPEGRPAAVEDPVALAARARAQEDREYFAARNAALTPITHPAMGGGYTVNPSLLPPRFQPKQSGIGAPVPASRASLEMSDLPDSAFRAANPGVMAGGKPAEGGTGGGGGSRGGGGGGEERADWNKTGTTNLADQQKRGQAVGQRMDAELEATKLAEALNLPPSMVPLLMTPEGRQRALDALAAGTMRRSSGQMNLGGENVGQPVAGPWANRYELGDRVPIVGALTDPYDERYGRVRF